MIAPLNSFLFIFPVEHIIDKSVYIKNWPDGKNHFFFNIAFGLRIDFSCKILLEFTVTLIVFFERKRGKSIGSKFERRGKKRTCISRQFCRFFTDSSQFIADGVNGVDHQKLITKLQEGMLIVSSCDFDPLQTHFEQLF